MGNSAPGKKPEGKVTDHWHIDKKLGQGSFGTVRLARKKRESDGIRANQEAAVKIIEKRNLSANELKNLDRESRILALADHPNCVRLYQIFDTNRRLYLVMELCRGGELFDAITSREGAFNEEQAADVVRQVASALDYLHNQGIAHRDLKPENILYADEEQTVIKLMDFGLAKLLDSQDDNLMTRCGTLHYVAPEVLSRKKGYSNKCDCWSLGVVLYVLLCGYLPFYHEQRDTTAKLIRLGRFEFDPEEWSEVSDPAKDLIRSLICLDVESRLTPAQVLEHPWITGDSEQASPQEMPHAYSERFNDFNRRRHMENLEIMAAMANSSIQMRRWIKAAADACGQTDAVDEHPEVEIHE